MLFLKIEEAFGVVLKKRRNKAGISQELLASLCNLDRTYISLLERGKRRPTINTIFVICENLDIKPSRLVQQIEDLLIKSPKDGT